MCKKLIVLALSLCVISSAGADTVIWDFENGNDHGFTLWSVVPPIPEPDDPQKAGDEALTGGLPAAGVAWCIGTPDEFNGQEAVPNGGILNWNNKYPSMVGKGTLNTYALNQHGDFVHTEENDQIATSPFVILESGAVLTAVSGGGGGHDPVLDANPANGYTNNSGGIAVRSAANDTILATTGLGGGGSLAEFTIDLSAFAGQKVYIDVVDAHVGSYGWTIVDEILISNATDLGLIPPGEAINPYPEDEAVDVTRDVILNWTPGAFAPAVNGHNIYFSEDFSDVNDGVGGITLDANSYNPGRLDFGTTYYWRVDEVNGVDATVYEGQVWSFTVESLAYPISSERIIATASSNEEGKSPENTVNGFGLDPNDFHSIDVTDMWLSNINDQGPVWIKYELNKVYMLHEMLIWNYNGQSVLSMFGLRDVTIEYSTDDSEWTTLTDVPEVNMATGRVDYTYNTTVAFNGAAVKYVKITANSNWSDGLFTQYGLSEVRFMYIPTDARSPFPKDGATDIALDTTLGWTPGRDAVEHNVYFNDDEQSVIDGTVSAETVSDASYGPLSLDLGSIYYWRVDEVNSVNVVPIWEGNVWSFTTLEYLVVDDFEDYNDYEPDEVWRTWVDGYEVPTNGSSAGYPDPDFLDGEHYVETETVHSGEQSMPLFYDNTGGVNNSEVSRTFSTAQDWTRVGINTLTLYVYGQAGNVGGQLYLKVNGVEKAADVDFTAESWQEVNIELASFGVDLQRVTSLAISIQGAGSGMVFIDDILLYGLYAPLNN